jgi:hypothetical protein
MSVPTARENWNQCKRRFVSFKALQPVFALEERNKFAITTAQDTNATNFTQSRN